VNRSNRPARRRDLPQDRRHAVLEKCAVRDRHFAPFHQRPAVLLVPRVELLQIAVPPHRLDLEPDLSQGI
jgi:hypothetical protein